MPFDNEDQKSILILSMDLCRGKSFCTGIRQLISVVTCFVVICVLMIFCVQMNFHRERKSNNRIDQSLILIYETNVDQMDSKIILDQISDYFHINHLTINSMEFFPSKSVVKRKINEKNIDREMFIFNEKKSYLSLNVTLNDYRWKNLSSLNNRLNSSKIFISMTDGKRSNFTLNFHSIVPLNTQVINQSMKKNPRAGPCQGGLYPNDDRCVSYSYGSDEIQVIDCHLPRGDRTSLVVLLVHGGYWRSLYNRSIENDVGNDLVGHGIVVCTLDYRSVGNGGGYPNTFYDVSNGTDLLPLIGQEQDFSLDHLIFVGHSAGGQLAGFLTGRFRLRSDQPGYSPHPVRPIAFVSQAGVNNMWDGCDQWKETGEGAVIDFLGGRYGQYPERYLLSSLGSSSKAAVSSKYPSEYLPLEVPIQAITGSLDVTVPISQTTNFAAQSMKAGDDCREVIVDGEDHFVHLNSSSKSWQITRSFILSFNS